MEQESDEIEKIKERYEARKNKSVDTDNLTRYGVPEKEKIYRKIIHTGFKRASDIEFLEIGAGGGTNIYFFKSLDILPENIVANELLEDRVGALRKNHPDIRVVPGNALDMDETQKFDLIFQSTVFTSILDPKLKKQLAQKMLRLLKPGGIILWYDFAYDNPRNKDVKGIGNREIRELFSGATVVETYKVTLAPPIARRVGRLYRIFNLFPFLRTHRIVVVHFG